jgi:hypothetical protein
MCCIILFEQFFFSLQTVLQTHLPTLSAAFRKLCTPPVQPVETVAPSAPQFLTRANRGVTKVQNSVAAPVATKKSITPAQFAQLMTVCFDAYQIPIRLSDSSLNVSCLSCRTLA